MKTHTRAILAGAFAATCLQVQADDFPAGATTPTAGEIGRHFSGRVFDVALRDGTAWRVEFNTLGYFFVDTSKGGRAEGSWRAEDGRLCSQVRGRDAACNDVRAHDGHFHLKRTSGEVIRYVPR